MATVCLQWAKGQPQATSDRSGKADMRGAYGLLGQEMIGWLTHLQHTPDKNVWLVGLLDKRLSDIGAVCIWRAARLLDPHLPFLIRDGGPDDPCKSRRSRPHTSVASTTRTDTAIDEKSVDAPRKRPDTGMIWRLLRATATGTRLAPPTRLCVGSKVIQPALGR